MAAAKKRWRMFGIAAALAALVVALGAMAVSASQHFAQNQPACDEVGGEFVHNPSGTNTCTVEGFVGPVEETGTAGPQDNWRVFTQTTVEDTVYYWSPGNITDVDEGEETTVVVYCLNPGDQQMNPGEGHCPSN